MTEWEHDELMSEIRRREDRLNQIEERKAVLRSFMRTMEQIQALPETDERDCR